MPYIAAKCPNCGGELQLNTDMEHGQCTHCTAYVYFESESQKIKIVNPINIKGSTELNNLIRLIEMDLESGRNQTPEFRDRLKRALNQDANNEFLYNLYISQIWDAKIQNSVLIKYTGQSKNFIVPHNITSIGHRAFKECKQLRNVTMHKNISFIARDIFYNDILITIRTYSNTFAAQYAMEKHTFLYLIDAPKETREVYNSIQYSLRELLLNKNNMNLQFDIFQTQKYDRISDNIIALWGIFIFASILLAFFSVLHIDNMIGFVIATMFLGTVMMFYSAFIVPDDQKNKETLHLKSSYYSLCNKYLHSLGVADYRYTRKIINRDIRELEDDARKIETAKNKLLNINVKKFIKDNQIKFKVIHF